ncbi:MAG: transcription antitermination factor NusB [Candidatus Krumholzibacteriia bacterium]
MSVDLRRRAAVRAIVQVGAGHDLDHQLAGLRTRLAHAEGARIAEELVRGVVQFRDRYAHLVATFSRRGADPDPVVNAVLALALHELLTHDRVPAYAAVHQAGELLRAEGKTRQLGYANAVLQSVVRHLEARDTAPLDAVRPLFAAPEDPAGELARWWSHPRWLVERWLARYGRDAVDCLLAHANTPAPVTLHVLPGDDVDQARRHVEAAGWAVTPVAAAPRALSLVGRPSQAALADLLDGRPDLLVQDAGAQAALDWLCRDGADLQGMDAPVVDLCAAPGGKAAHLRAWLPGTQLLVAMDLRPRRLRRLRANARRLAWRHTALLAGDGMRAPLRPRSCGAVLLDGPCSGTGVGRHHPEGRWRLAPETLQRNGERLGALAAAAADLLVDGGSLYYATCSLEPEENEDVLAALLAARPELVADPDPDGTWQRAWLPWLHGTDGFFAARLRRRTPAEARA